MRRTLAITCGLTIALVFCLGCPGPSPLPGTPIDDGIGNQELTENVTAKLGEPMPSLTAEQLDTFNRGKAVFQRRFDIADGLGPAFNVSFCGACHEKPVPGGSAGLYRNFFLGAEIADTGVFEFSESAGDAGGVLRMFNVGSGDARPAVPATTTVLAQRNAIPFFGAGLIQELPDEVILANADPNDADGDGISGRANFDSEFVGRFGRKAQTISLVGFIRGPLFNHLGITTDPLSSSLRAQLPVNISALDSAKEQGKVAPTGPHRQVAALEEGNSDSDGVSDPEMGAQDLFDLISFTMSLAAPRFDPPTEQTNRGWRLFDQANCSACHTPRLEGPRGLIGPYSDFLLHDMGAALADGIEMLEASGSEFRTQPLWGIAATGPYLHDGRTSSIEEAILLHAGEAQASRDSFAAFSDSNRDDVVAFLLSLGGSDQATAGLLPPGDPVPDTGAYGGPLRVLTESEEGQFMRGRAVFDRDFSFAEGTGALAGADGAARFNGDSCRACHFDPVLGGSGPLGVNVMRHGRVSTAGVFSAPSDTPNTILHKETGIGQPIVQPTTDINVLEMRQTPHTFGLGLIDAITEDTILGNADPNDADGDGISGRANVLSDGRVGRLGWKAQVPSLAEFVRDAMAAEIGLTIPEQSGLTFGLTVDSDGVADPELSLAEAEDLAFFLGLLSGPPRQPAEDQAQVDMGEALFSSVGCAKCHIASLSSGLGDVPLFSDLLLHEILPVGTPGIEDGLALQTEFRTAPLWGLSQTSPYFHTGEADTIDDAVRLHRGEADAVRTAYEALDRTDRDALLAFLSTL